VLAPLLGHVADQVAREFGLAAVATAGIALWFFSSPLLGLLWQSMVWQRSQTPDPGVAKRQRQSQSLVYPGWRLCLVASLGWLAMKAREHGGENAPGFRQQDYRVLLAEHFFATISEAHALFQRLNFG
jgi:hypothetical protein